MGTKLSLIAVDLETSGFTIDDHVTVVGLVLPLGSRIFCNTDGQEPFPGLEQTVRERVDSHVVLTTHPDEHALLEALESFACERLADDNFCLVGYNAERFRGGFDLPFLRTRAAANDLDWPFVDIAYADLQPIVQARFNTVSSDTDGNDHEEIADLCGAYDALIGGRFSELDPFGDSSEAVTAFEERAFEPLVIHNLADILRTQALADMAEQYCATSDFRLKSLTPPSRDTNLE